MYLFTDLVAALTARFDNPDDAVAPYLWLDIFVSSQHNTKSLDSAWWSNAFAQAIRAIGHTALVLQPWHAPVPLKRSWCLWEIFCTVLTDVRVEVLLPPGQSEEFHDALERRFDDIAAALSRIDTRCAIASKPEDKAMVDAAVNASNGGFFAVNSAVIGLIRNWLVTESRTLVAARIAAHGEADVRTLTAKSNLARLLAAHGQLDEAVSLYSDVLKHRATALASSQDVLAADVTSVRPRSSVSSQREAYWEALSAVAAYRGARGELGASVEMHRRVLRERRATMRHSEEAAYANAAGAAHASSNDVALVESRLAYARALIAFSAQPAGLMFRVDPSEWLMSTWPCRVQWWVLKKVFDSAMPGNVSWPFTLMRLAMHLPFIAVLTVPLLLFEILVALLKFSFKVKATGISLRCLYEAERLCAETVTLLERTRGVDAPATLECQVLRATALRDQSRLKAAAKLLRAAAQSLEEQLGPAHVTTCAAQAELADLQREDGDVAAAEATFRSLAIRLAEQLGDSHPDARAARINVALCVACRGELAGAATLLEAEKLNGSAGVMDEAMDTSAPGRLLHAGLATMAYVRDELMAKANDHCDPETCENTIVTVPCVSFGIIKPNRNERLGNIFRRVLLRHTRAGRRRSVYAWTRIAASSALLLGMGVSLGLFYLFSGGG